MNKFRDSIFALPLTQKLKKYRKIYTPKHETQTQPPEGAKTFKRYTFG